jgi:transposase InsO family protein
VVRAREAHPSWGGKKLRAWLTRRAPATPVPARSTIDAICDRHGLVRTRRRRLRAPPALRALTRPSAANHVWAVDYKGWFRVGTGHRCEPLTITDGWSRYLVRCEAHPGIDGALAQQSFVRAFRTYGLPDVIRSDNGPPFASVGLGGLSRLSVWWIRLGIRPERITPGHPEENGSHERFHRTLAQETTRPPQATLRGQQRVFDAFRAQYNTERPHEALDLEVPAARYTPSPRPYPERLPEWHYLPPVVVRRVAPSGHIKWYGQKYFLGEALAGVEVGFAPTADGVWQVQLHDWDLGVFDAEWGGIRGAASPP